MSPLNIKAALFGILASVFAAGGSILPGTVVGEAPDTNWKSALLGTILSGVMAFFFRQTKSPAERADYASLGFRSSTSEFKKKQRKGFGWASILGAAIQIGMQIVSGAPVKQAVVGGIAGAVIGGTAYATPQEDGYADKAMPESNR